MKKYFLLFLSISFLLSCVPSKNLIYLQGEPIQEKGIKRITLYAEQNLINMSNYFRFYIDNLKNFKK